MRKRIGVAKHTKVPVTWAVECPLHPTETKVDMAPLGPVPASSKVNYGMRQYYCPQGSGHTFNLEDAKATIYNDDGTVAVSGAALLDYLDF
jgi:hypothetical protein